mgnify:CR=1 FL=1
MQDNFTVIAVGVRIIPCGFQKGRQHRMNQDQQKEIYSEPIVLKHESLREVTGGGKYAEKVTDVFDAN